jgi:hypothetical protein
MPADRIPRDMSMDLVEFTTTGDSENTTHLRLDPATIERFDAMHALGACAMEAS